MHVVVILELLEEFANFAAMLVAQFRELLWHIANFARDH